MKKGTLADFGRANSIYAGEVLEEMGPVHKLLSPGKVFIAGGLFRAWLNKEETADIDVFVADKNVFYQTIGLLILNGLHIAAETPKSITLAGEWGGKKRIVQVIRHKFFKRPKEYLNHVDYTIAQFVYDGQTIYCTEEAIADSKARRLRMVDPAEWNDMASSMYRYFKFRAKGYEDPGRATETKIMERVKEQCAGSYESEEQDPIF